jgi:flavodoxin
LYVPEQQYYSSFVTGFRKVVEDWVYEKQGFEPNLTEYCLDGTRIYDYSDSNLNRLDLNSYIRLNEVLLENNWTVRECNDDYCEATTYDVTLLDDIFLDSKGQKETPYRVSRKFDERRIQSELYEVNGDPYEDLYYLQQILKDDISASNKEAIIKKYTAAGGDNEDWDDIVEELEDYCEELADSLATWYNEQEYLCWMKAYQTHYSDALYDTKFFTIDTFKGQHRIQLYCRNEDENYSYIINFLEGGETFFPEQFDIKEIERDAENDTEGVDPHKMNDFLDYELKE